jgi:hypothetical protein
MVAAGSVVGAHYLLRQRIGDATGVWRADDTTSRLTVAVRVLDQDAPDPQTVARFLAGAARAAARRASQCMRRAAGERRRTPIVVSPARP